MDIKKHISERLTEIKIQEKKNHLSRWQKFVVLDMPGTTQLPEPVLKEITEQQIEIDIRVIEESRRVVNSTLNPEEFFPAIDKYLERNEHLATLQWFMAYPKQPENNPYNRAIERYNKYVDAFLIKYFSREDVKSAEGLKPFYKYMDEEHVKYIEERFSPNAEHHHSHGEDCTCGHCHDHDHEHHHHDHEHHH